MTQGEIEKIGSPAAKIFSDLEIRIMKDIVRRIKINGFSTASADWQITRLQQLGNSEEDIKGWIKGALSASDAEIERIFSDETYREYMGHERAYKILGKEQIPYEENVTLQRLIEAAKRQMSLEFHNMANSMGFAVRNPQGKILYTPLLKYYRKTLDNAVMDIKSGAFSYQKVLERTIKEMTDSGIRWINYDSGWHNRVDVAARRAIITGFRQVQGKINEQVAEDLHTDSYEVTYHVGARTSHQPWQGKVYTRQELETICGLGTVTGLHGANCYHDYRAFIPGVSVRTYTDEQLEQMTREENTPKEYYGRKYTTYEALQQQRKMETSMRATRQQIQLLKDGEADPMSITLKKAKYYGQMQNYEDFSEKMKLPLQKTRIYQDGLKGNFSDKRAYDRLQIKKVDKKSDNDKILSKEQVIKKAKQYGEDVLRGKQQLNYDNGNVIFDYVSRMLEYDGVPKVVNADDFSELEKKSPIGVMYRGVSADSLEEAKGYANEFMYGKMYAGKSYVYGSGIYFSPDKDVAERYNPYGIMLKSVLKEDAKVVKYQDIIKEYSETGADVARLKKGDSTEAWEDILRTVGEYAAIKGYDAIDMDGAFDRTHIIVLNRRKVVVGKL